MKTEMISLDEALLKIDSAVEPLPVQRVSGLDAVGCAVAEDMTAAFHIPNFASSAMDGIAIRIADLMEKLPVKLQIQGIIPAGQPADEPLKPRHAYRIMTGAALPEGADSVIKVEDLEFNGDHVTVSSIPPKGDQVRPVGNDIRKGDIVFPAGYALKPIEAGIVASLGLTDIPVHPRPKIALFATGSEIRQPGETLQPGQIYNSNDTTLRAMIVSFGLPDPGILPFLADDPEKLAPVISSLCGENDVVITSGAVSMGNFDFIPGIVEQLGGELLFHKVFVKPGKPTLIARIGECWLLALPGNPVSVAVTFHLYGKRLLSLLMGKIYKPVREKAELAASFPVKGERFQVVAAELLRSDGRLQAVPADNYSSGRLSALKGIDGFILVPGGTREVVKGSEVEVEWL